MKLTLSLSPCPNDTFMFDALLHGRIDTEGLCFEATFADIEQLNDAVTRSQSDISKISYAVLPLIRNRYQVLDSGSALGRGNGPLLVGRHALRREDLQGLKIAVPGLHTTAHLLLKRLFPGIGSCSPHLFSDIAPIVARGDYKAGVLIHEGRFTYAKFGLQLIADLGLEWERVTALPLPLGAIVVSRNLEPELRKTVDRVLRRSIEYAFAHPEASAEFVRQHAQELDPEVTRQHIELFVNRYSLSLGDEGRRAVMTLLDIHDQEIFV